MNHANDDYNGVGPYVEGGNFNVISPDIDPLVARNIASYYAIKDEPWADGMARRLRVAANDSEGGAVTRRMVSP